MTLHPCLFLSVKNGLLPDNSLNIQSLPSGGHMSNPLACMILSLVGMITSLNSSAKKKSRKA